MTVKIANLTAQFIDSSMTYVGIGLHVIDAGSNVDSKVMNFSVNSNNKFSIGKDGTIEINGYVPDNYELFVINERNNNLVRVTNNVAALNTTTYVKTYAEGYADILTNETNDLTVDLSQATIFGTTSNQINSISFIAPRTLHGKDEAYSCSIMFYNDTLFQQGNIWFDAGVKWSYGIPPGEELGGPSMLTFLNINTEPNVWYGTISGIAFQYYIE